jgi:hypothetical protein
MALAVKYTLETQSLRKRSENSRPISTPAAVNILERSLLDAVATLIP